MHSEPVDAYSQLNPDGDNFAVALCRTSLKGCCSGCAIPVGLFRAMQVAAGLALPKDVHIQIEKAEE